MLNLLWLSLIAFLTCVGGAQPAASARQQQQTRQPAPAVDEWTDGFGGQALDESKWERFSFQGIGGGKLEFKEGQLRMRGPEGSRAGVRSKQSFSGDRFIVEATLAKAGPTMLAPGKEGLPLGHSVLAIMFDGTGRNRVEWVLTSEGAFEAWSVVDGRGEQLDNSKLGTKIRNPVLGIVRRGDEFLFMLNGGEVLRSAIRNLPRSFRVMLYGNSSTENHWDSARVVTVK